MQFQGYNKKFNFLEDLINNQYYNNNNNSTNNNTNSNNIHQPQQIIESHYYCHGQVTSPISITIRDFGILQIPCVESQLHDIVERFKYRCTYRGIYEIPLDLISFDDDVWSSTKKIMIEKVKVGLNIEESQKLNLELYKLLIYDKDSCAAAFIKPKTFSGFGSGNNSSGGEESENENNKFKIPKGNKTNNSNNNNNNNINNFIGTLGMVLPSTHSGGDLIIKHRNDKQVVIGLQVEPEPTAYIIKYAAFNSNCSYEIQTVTSGYRVTLLYKIMKTGKRKSSYSSSSSSSSNSSSSSSSNSTSSSPSSILSSPSFSPIQPTQSIQPISPNSINTSTTTTTTTTNSSSTTSSLLLSPIPIPIPIFDLANNIQEIKNEIKNIFSTSTSSNNNNNKNNSNQQKIIYVLENEYEKVDQLNGNDQIIFEKLKSSIHTDNEYTLYLSTLYIEEIILKKENKIQHNNVFLGDLINCSTTSSVNSKEEEGEREEERVEGIEQQQQQQHTVNLENEILPRESLSHLKPYKIKNYNIKYYKASVLIILKNIKNKNL